MLTSLNTKALVFYAARLERRAELSYNAETLLGTVNMRWLLKEPKRYALLMEIFSKANDAELSCKWSVLSSPKLFKDKDELDYTVREFRRRRIVKIDRRVDLVKITLTERGA